MKVLKNILMAAFCCICLYASAQQADSTLTPLQGYINFDRTLSRGRYLVQSNLKIGRKATLTIEAGSTVFFNPGALVEVYGGLTIQGEANNFVYLKSINEKEEGMGFSIVSDNAEKEINIEFAYFTRLLQPITFERNWYRTGVTIANSQFRGIDNKDLAISVNETEFIKNPARLEFNFTQNVVADNYTTVYVKEFNSFNVKYNFTKNIFYNNIFSDFKSRPKNNVLFGEEDEKTKDYNLSLEGNVFINNILLNESYDTLMDNGSFGLAGTAETFDAPKNYWGYKLDGDKALKYVYGYNKDNFSPQINLAPTLTEAPADVHGFVDRIFIDNGEYNPRLPVTDLFDKKIKLRFNKPIMPNQGPKLQLTYLDTATGKMITEFYTAFIFSYNPKTVEAELVITIPENVPHAYHITLQGLYDREGFELPHTDFGFFYFHTIYGLYKSNQVLDLSVFMTKVSLIKDIEEPVETAPKIHHRSWEFGVMNGVTNYFGDLSTNNFNRDEMNYFLGLRTRYNFNKRMSLRGLLNYGHLSGSDRKSDNPYRLARGLSFRSLLIDASCQIEYHLNQYQFNDRNRFIPSISTGIVLFYFNPKGKYNGKWYALQPIGTEGQTITPGMKKYSRVQVALPISLSFKTMVKRHWIMELEVNYVKTFTDYLDDVSGTYTDINKLKAANPGREDIVAALADPGESNKPGSQRGYPNKKDWYLLVGLTLLYRF